MPHHPKNVPLHMMLRRNVGGGRDPLEGLQVRWWVVARLLHALCAFPRKGCPPWRLGGSMEEPMHKYYDPREFDVMLEEGPTPASTEGFPSIDSMEKGLKIQYAPKVSEGVVMSEVDAAGLSKDEAVAKSIDIERPEDFVAAGFDVNFVGPEGELLVRDGGAAEASGPADDMHVEEDVFCRWVESAQMRVAAAVAMSSIKRTATTQCFGNWADSLNADAAASALARSPYKKRAVSAT